MEPIFTVNSEGLTVSLPDLWTAFHWYHLLFISGAYGLITHLKTLPEVYRWVDSDEVRMTLVLPLRITAFVAGVGWAFISLPALGKFPIRNNPMLKFAWTWHESPKEIY